MIESIKVGDRVRCLSDSFWLCGNTGVVTDILPIQHGAMVAFDHWPNNDPNNIQFCLISDLKPISDPAPGVTP